MEDQNKCVENNTAKQDAEIQPYNKEYILCIRPQALPIGSRLHTTSTARPMYLTASSFCQKI
jgi:hypothetical protein